MPLDAVPLPVSSLPGLVAGPILRRLTRTEVSVWVACAAPDPITLVVRQRSGGGPPPASVTRQPDQVGVALWMTVLTAGAPGGTFVDGQVYEYELQAPWETTIRGPIPWNDISLPGANFPTFLAPPTSVADLRLLHASCRKPHGNGRDALALAMDELAHRFDAPLPQPQLLVLTGDQIYADEVGHALMPRVLRIAADLIGIDETDRLGPLPPIGGRGPGTRALGFTGSTANHLWSFGEYVAMYLLVWSPVLWPAVLPAFPPPAFPRDVDPSVTQAEWDAELANIELFRAALPAVRQVLANVPSLMIFDDHEVTDDWNLDHRWIASVHSSAGGRRVVANGLLAYLLCQHWGNKPAAFDIPRSPERLVLDEVTRAAAPPRASRAEIAAPVLGVPAGALPAAPPPQALRDLTAAGAVRYDMTLEPADGWPARIVVLDERTAREYPTEDGLGARISRAALAEQLPPPVTPAPLTIVVAAAPVLGTYVFEEVVQPLLRLLKSDGERFADYESWSTVIANQQDLLARLALHHPVVILSGDLHYGYTSALTRTEGGVITRVAQLTSSGAKNFEFKHSALGQYGELALRLGLERSRAYTGYDQLSPADRQTMLGAPPAGSVLPWDDAGEVLLGRVVRDAVSEPTALPAAVAAAYGLAAPNWTYTIEPVDDPMATYAAPAIDAPWNGWDPTASLAVAAALQAADLERMSKMFVGLPNLGVVEFAVAAGSITVRQELRVPVGAAELAPPAARHQAKTAVTLT